MSVSSATKVHAKGCQEGRDKVGGWVGMKLLVCSRMWVKGAVAKSSWHVGEPFKN